MQDIPDILRRLENLIRWGTVADIQTTPPRVRMQSGGLLTDWLPWAAFSADKNSTWEPPATGAQGLIFSPSGDPQTGGVLFGFPSDSYPAPSSDLAERCTHYADGAIISYHTGTGHLKATGIKTGLIQAAQKLTADCPEVEATGNVTIGGNLLVKGKTTSQGMLTYTAGMTGSGGTGGATATITGNIAHSGGTITSSSPVQDGHVHDDAHGGTTGKPK